MRLHLSIHLKILHRRMVMNFLKLQYLFLILAILYLLLLNKSLDYYNDRLKLLSYLFLKVIYLFLKLPFSHYFFVKLFVQIYLDFHQLIFSVLLQLHLSILEIKFNLVTIRVGFQVNIVKENHSY